MYLWFELFYKESSRIPPCMHIKRLVYAQPTTCIRTYACDEHVTSSAIIFIIAFVTFANDLKQLIQLYNKDPAHFKTIIIKMNENSIINKYALMSDLQKKEVRINHVKNMHKKIRRISPLNSRPTSFELSTKISCYYSVVYPKTYCDVLMSLRGNFFIVFRQFSVDY